MVDITENFVTECLLKVQTFFESICGKMFSWKVVYGWMDKITKKERKYYLPMKCSVSTQKTLVIEVHAADVRYHLNCWSGVTVKYRSARPVQLLRLFLLLDGWILL